MSDPATGIFTVTGSTGTEASQLDLWVPDRGDGAPTLTGSGLGEVEVEEVDGGFRVLAEVTGDYVVTNGTS